MTSPATALALSDSGETYTVTATGTGIVCTCPARVLCCHGAAALVAWAATYAPADDPVPWITDEPSVEAEQRRVEQVASFYEQQAALWGPHYRTYR